MEHSAIGSKHRILNPAMHKRLIYEPVSKHACRQAFAFPLNLQPRESEIVTPFFQSEKSIRGEPMESCTLRYFNSFEFFDHTTST